MKRILVSAAVGMLALMTIAGPVGARTFGAVYANDQIYRVFGNAANVPDGTGTDPFAKFTNSTNADQFGVAEFAPGSPTGHHGGRWAVYTAIWTSGDASTLNRSADTNAQGDAARLSLHAAGVARFLQAALRAARARSITASGRARCLGVAMNEISGEASAGR